MVSQPDGEEFPIESVEVAVEEHADESETNAALEDSERMPGLSPEGIAYSDGGRMKRNEYADAGTYWVVRGIVVFGPNYDESILLHEDLSEEAWQQQLDEWAHSLQDQTRHEVRLGSGHVARPQSSPNRTARLTTVRFHRHFSSALPLLKSIEFGSQAT